jgi:hypothetical protein
MPCLCPGGDPGHGHGPTYGFALGVVVTGSFEVRGGGLGRRQDAPPDPPGDSPARKRAEGHNLLTLETSHQDWWTSHGFSASRMMVRDAHSLLMVSYRAGRTTKCPIIDGI